MAKTYHVIVTRCTTESVTITLEADNPAQANDMAWDRSRHDESLEWEQDDTPNASKEHYVTSVQLRREKVG